MSHREQPEYCDFCDHETKALKWYGTGPGETELGATGAWLCTICEATPAGNVALHPRAHHSTDTDVLKTIVITTRMILDALKERPA